MFFFLISLASVAQTQKGYVDIKGKVREGGKALAGVQVKLYENSQLIKTKKTASNGKFILKLDFDKKYTLQFSKKDFVTKKVDFDTHVDEKQYVWPYSFSIELFKMIEGLDISALSAPVTKIGYTKEEGDFVFDIPYTNTMKAKINKIQNQIETLKKNAYKNKIAAADKKFSTKAYADAIKLYEEAIDINPYTDYPDDRIMECERRLSNVENDKEDYERAIASADAYFTQKNYPKAKIDYKKALAIYSDKKHPKDRLNEISVLLAQKEKADKKAKYDNIIKKSDALFASKDLESAKKGYQAALKILPAEQYPKGKIAEIDAQFAENDKNAAINSNYTAKINEGDRLFAKREYVIAKNAYLAASKIKPQEKYPKEKLKEIESKMASMESDRNYADKLKEADALLSKNELIAAKKSYNEALKIKATETYPQKKITEIDAKLALIANKEELDKNYSNFIKQADSQFASKDLQAAKVNYNKALSLKSKEKYPQDKIKAIDVLLAEKASNEQKNQEYAKLIKNGDAGLSQKQYSAAKIAYTSALKIKPNEAYPKTKIAEIDAALAELDASKAKEEQYANAILDADKKLSKKSYQDAKLAYQSALSIKPNEAYPKTKISEIDKTLSALADASAKEKQYNDLISSADKSLGTKQYTDAKSKYESALNLKPNEAYPTQKIKEITAALALLAANKAKEEEYNSKIKLADAAFAKKDYKSAKTNYVAAIGLKSKESYPKQKVEEIDGILAGLANAAEKDKLYQERIKVGDSELANKKYEAAILAYQSALKLKSEEQYPKTKISDINKIKQELAAAQAKEEQYANAISDGDKKLSKKSYQDAKLAYQSALSIKPNEAYPKTKISEIDKTLTQLADNKATEDKYNNQMKDAEAKFEAKQFVEAKASYKLALEIKSGELYPTNKIKEIDGILAELAANKSKDNDYNNKIKLADAAFAKKEYSSAKTSYLSALEIKSKEAYPKQKIKEIDKLLQVLAKAEGVTKQYNAIIKDADAKFTAKSYESSKLAYESALKLKPNEQYPKDKLKAISTAVALVEKNAADAKALDEKYNLKIAEGDRLLAKREFQISKKSYEEASELKPNESYPKGKIEEINGLLAGIATDTQYAAALKEGSDYVSQKKYDDAKLAYQAASEIKPNESFPKEKIKEIDGLVAKAEKARLLAVYKRLMADADKKMSAKDYLAARDLYQQAIENNKTAQYPKDRIKEIDKLLLAEANKDKVKAKKQQDYVALVQAGDAAFSKKSYSTAKMKYIKASELMPKQSYPKNKLKEIAKLTAPVAEIPEEIDFNDKEAKKKFMSSMAQKYGEGIHVENYESKSGKKVKRVIVVDGGLASEYREVKQPWGATYFFKNGKTISRAIFVKETK